jgi:uncharacterized membrane protein YkvA (DUF1232 family)
MTEQSRPSGPATRTNTSFLGGIVRDARLAWRLFTDERVSGMLKLIPPAALMYTLFPVDFIPDLVPGLGQLDDLGIIVLGLKLFIQLAPPAIVQQHLAEIQGIQGSWRVVDEEQPASGEVIDPPYRIEK